MAHLLIGADDFTLDDRLLEHVRFVVTQKLRRGEPFLLTWSYPADQGSGRRSVWIHEGSMLQFRFAKPLAAPLNPAWLKGLLEGAHSVRGLNLDDVPEPVGQAGPAEAADDAVIGAAVGVGRRT